MYINKQQNRWRGYPRGHQARDMARGVRVEAPMNWVPRRSVSADGCPWEGMTCAMRSRYSPSKHN